jgi:hypothetical protein
MVKRKSRPLRLHKDSQGYYIKLKGKRIRIKTDKKKADVVKVIIKKFKKKFKN